MQDLQISDYKDYLLFQRAIAIRQLAEIDSEIAEFDRRESDTIRNSSGNTPEEQKLLDTASEMGEERV